VGQLAYSRPLVAVLNEPAATPAIHLGAEIARAADGVLILAYAVPPIGTLGVGDWATGAAALPHPDDLQCGVEALAAARAHVPADVRVVERLVRRQEPWHEQILRAADWEDADVIVAPAPPMPWLFRMVQSRRLRRLRAQAWIPVIEMHEIDPPATRLRLAPAA
jgi:nucleotide-binding universal stress UspA family protein